MTFSERMGIEKPRTKIQKDSITKELRNSIWNYFDLDILDFFDDYEAYSRTNNAGYKSMINLRELLWLNFFKSPIDRCPYNNSDFVSSLRDWFFKCDWNKIYDFIEFIIANHNVNEHIELFTKHLNFVFEREMAGYRIISGIVTPIISDSDINEIENALNAPFKEIKIHLNCALELMSDKKKPDYRNSIKESISAVEYICKTITKNKNATLGEALDMLQKTGKIQIHSALNTAFDKIYGYTSSADGIRHSLIDEKTVNLDLEDATFMLTSCSAFINYLIIKSDKAGIKF